MGLGEAIPRNRPRHGGGPVWLKAMIFRYRARKEEEGRTEPVKCSTKEKRKMMENTNTMNNNFAF